jgi:DNA-binding beta-propeller fold protein YncE
LVARSNITCLICLLLGVTSAVASSLRVTSAHSEEAGPLRLEATIALGDVRGRIDHMAIDIGRRRLFVAELGNDTVSVVDLDARKVVKRLSGLHEPQGVAYLPATDTLYIANGGDGTLRLFHGSQYEDNGSIALGDDADNVRIDPLTRLVLVGYGAGGIAVIDPIARAKIADVPLRAHPESFQVDAATGRAYANVPNAHRIGVVDLNAVQQVASWATGGLSSNFPMALDGESKRVLVMFRSPPKLSVFNMQDGSPVATADACADADDIFVDTKHRFVYVSCGAGVIDVLDTQSYGRVARIPTASGARTSLYVPELDRLYLAVRAAGGNPAAIWAFRPAP